MKPELEALYEGLCRREPDLFEPEALHKQLDVLTSAVSLETLDALLQLCAGHKTPEGKKPSRDVPEQDCL